MSDDKTKILNQVEFYFSDSNLLNDRFLFTTQNANDGWVPISVISQFERMKKYRPIEIIVEALKSSPELLEVSENNELVRRKIPLPTNHNEVQLGIAKRSVVVQNIPVSANLDDLLEFFNKVSPVNQVRMKKKNKEFTGSCIVEFKKELDAENFLKLENVKYKDNDLILLSKVNYDESKAQKFGERRGGKGRGRKPRDFKKENKEDGKDDEKVDEKVDEESKMEQTERDLKRDRSPKREDKEENVRERD